VRFHIQFLQQGSTPGLLFGYSSYEGHSIFLTGQAWNISGIFLLYTSI